jgi:site-specific DNA-methyltransferase (adenine-specific)
MEINITNEDCMELLRRTPDGFYDLAIVDPPYGIKADRAFVRKTPAKDPRNGRPILTRPKKVGFWDNERPSAEYFNELRRVSKNQIIWGGNYFADLLPAKSCWVVWDKVNGGSDQADCELAWTSFNTAVRQIEYMWCIAQGKSAENGKMGQGNNKLWEKKIHPTQKPAILYEWLLRNYAKPGQTILDTHMGSGSIAIAAYNMGFDLTACELDTDYYNAAMKRIEAHIQKHPRGQDLLPKRVTLNNQLPLEFFTQ